MLAALMAFGIVILLGTGMGLMFSAINVMYRDWTRVVQIFTQMLPFSVPMMYPYTLVRVRFEDFPVIAHLYLFNPITEAVLLMQRGVLDHHGERRGRRGGRARSTGSARPARRTSRRTSSRGG